MALQSMHIQQPAYTTPILSVHQFESLFLHPQDSIHGETPLQTKDENPLALAWLEYYISQELTFQFDGNKEKLIPWIKKFRALRSNALWCKAPYITVGGVTYDLLVDSTKIKESVIKEQACHHFPRIINY